MKSAKIVVLKKRRPTVLKFHECLGFIFSWFYFHKWPTWKLTWSNATKLNTIPYSGKVWRAEYLVNLLFWAFGEKKFGEYSNGSAKGLSMVGINLDGFSLANRLRFAKFAKLSRYTVLLIFKFFENLNFTNLSNPWNSRNLSTLKKNQLYDSMYSIVSNSLGAMLDSQIFLELQ